MRIAPPDVTRASAVGGVLLVDPPLGRSRRWISRQMSQRIRPKQPCRSLGTMLVSIARERRVVIVACASLMGPPQRQWHGTMFSGVNVGGVMIAARLFPRGGTLRVVPRDSATDLYTSRSAVWDQLDSPVRRPIDRTRRPTTTVLKADMAVSQSPSTA